MVIGNSVLGRPLEVTQFGNGPLELMIIAGIHGGTEVNTIELADQLGEYLSSHPEIVPPNVTLWMLRALNPDGEAKGRVWSARGNENGVDLNRNFPALWEADWDRGGCWDYMRLTSGPEPGSEPETQALMRFLLTHHVDALINYHSSALGIFAGGQPPDPESSRLAQRIGDISEYPYPPIDTGCSYSGQLIDWASDHGIAAIDVELSNELDTDFEQNLAILAAFLAWQPERQ
ncbi:MAG: M14 family metallopeptidase [Anaerolineae bacterium]|nr:M14 family metallopeptidase [Anaerolineae bacterium]